jgi:hypothetical protein
MVFSRGGRIGKIQGFRDEKSTTCEGISSRNFTSYREWIMVDEIGSCIFYSANSAIPYGWRFVQWLDGLDNYIIIQRVF